MIITRRALSLAALGSPFVLRGAHAQAPYPNRPLTWIVPFTAAGVTDSNSRLVSRKLGERLGQTVVIENRPGAGGTLGTEYAARAEPDGYTLLYGTNAAMSGAPALYKRLGYDPVTSFTPIQGLAESSNVFVCNPNRPYRTLEEFVAYAKANPGRVNIAHAGVGTATHLVGVLLGAEAGIDMTFVSYTGSARALTDLVAGTVDVMFDYVVATRDHIAANRLRALAVTAKERIPALASVPTVVEAGLPGTVSSAWSGIFTQSAVPAPILARLRSAAAEVIRDPEVRNFFIGNGSRPLDEMNGEAMRGFVAGEVKRWGEIVRISGAEPA